MQNNRKNCFITLPWKRDVYLKFYIPSTMSTVILNILHEMIQLLDDHKK